MGKKGVGSLNHYFCFRIVHQTSIPGTQQTFFACRVQQVYTNRRLFIYLFFFLILGVELFIEDSLYNGRIRVASNGDLILNDARFEDQGLYTCQAFNSLHSVSAVIRFTVLSEFCGFSSIFALVIIVV